MVSERRIKTGTIFERRDFDRNADALNPVRQGEAPPHMTDKADRFMSEDIFIDSFNTMKARILADNTAKGFWDAPRNVGELIALMHSELSEALEAHRKDLDDNHLPHRKGVEVELADCMIRIMDTAAGLNLNVVEAMIEKLAYNRTRAHKHGKRY